MRKFLLMLVVLNAATVDSIAQQPTASEVLAKVASVYATCTSYYDEGSVSGDFTGRNAHFRTTFVKPSQFAFELWFGSDSRDKKNSWLVWKNGDSTQTRAPKTFLANFQNGEVPVDIALSRMAALSAGASLTIPPLLQPAPFRVSDLFASMTDIKIAGNEKINGHETLVIAATLLGQQQIKLWIDQNYLIVKTWRRVSFGGKSKFESTIRFEPKVNTKVPPERLLFEPPVDQKAASSTSSRSSLESLEGSPRLRKFGSSLNFIPADKSNPANLPDATDDEVVRVNTDLVVLPVMVVDSTGRVVTGLTREDFVIKEDDRFQEIASFSQGNSQDIPRSIVLIIDYSGSQLPYIRTSIEAARTLVDKLNPKDRMAVVTDDVRLVVDFTSDKDFLKAQLESFKLSALSGRLGASEQFDALMATLTELFSPEDIRPIVIFQTDGDQLEALKANPPLTPPSPFLLPRKYGLEDIQTAAVRARASVYSVVSGVRFAGMPESEMVKRGRADWENRENAFTELARAADPSTKIETSLPRDDYFLQSAQSWLRRQTALVNLSKFTGAWAEFLEQPGQAGEIYDRILKDIDGRYVIGYYPTNRARDGQRRTVHIEVRDHPEYEIWGHKTYFAPER